MARTVWLSAALSLVVAVGCQGQRKPLSGGTGGGAGNGPPPGSGGRSQTGGTGGAAGLPGGGSGGGAGGAPAACSGATDSRLVVAPQRVLRLTYNELLNTIRYLFGGDLATKLVTDKIISTGDDDSVEVKRLFPPLQQKSIVGPEYTRLDDIAQRVRDYVQANYATLAMTTGGCSTVTDACATAYLNKLAARAYRRNLTSAEQQRFTGLYNKLRSQTYNGYDVPGTVEEATADAVYALLSAPQMLWRQEFGDPAAASAAPAGLPLTDTELATHLAFFLTDEPPDDMLLAAANAGTLRPALASHVARLLDVPVTKVWLRTILETFYLVNKLRDTNIDPATFPALTPAMRDAMLIEVGMFMDNALWKGSNVTDFLLSRTTFLNTTLATTIYQVPVPVGATDEIFVETTLPSDRRAGLLTNAAFLTSRGRSDGLDLIVSRGRVVSATMSCFSPPPPDDVAAQATAPAKANFATQTGQQQVALRNAHAICADCHKQFDPYGLALENYDVIGRWRTQYPNLAGMPTIDASAELPAIVGGARVANAMQMAEKIAASPIFIDCLATALLQYALVDFDTAYVEPPLPPRKVGCAAADVSARFRTGNTKSFSDLVRATAASPAFILRRTE